MGGVGGRERKEGNDKIIFKLKFKKIEKKWPEQQNNRFWNCQGGNTIQSWS